MTFWMAALAILPQNNVAGITGEFVYYRLLLGSTKTVSVELR